MSTATHQPSAGVNEPGRQGLALDERVAARRERLITAGLNLLGGPDVGALSVRAVIRESGLAQRYFYESFRDREQLIEAVYATVLALAREGFFAHFRDASDLPTALRAAFAEGCDLTRADPRIGRVLFREPLVDPTVRHLASTALPEFMAGIVDAMRPEAAPASIHGYQASALAGSLFYLFLDWTEGRYTDKDSFTEYCTNLAIAVATTGDPRDS